MLYKNTIQLVFHISDLHIKSSLERSIINSFNKLINIINEYDKNTSLLVITGDIFDSYKDIPSSRSLFGNILTKLETNEIKTIFIPGNHDFSKNSMSYTIYDMNVDIDAISPLFINSRFKYVTYIKDTKSYPLDEENLLHIVSQLDHKTIYDVIPNKEKKNILLIHEGMHPGLKFNYRYTYNDVLERFDMIMAGDVHKHQFFNKEQSGGYAGSFIQTNSGEEINNHGFILWDLKKKRGTFHPIESELIFYSIKINKESDIASLMDISDLSRLKVVNVDYASLELKNKFSRLIEEKYGFISNEKINPTNDNQESKNMTIDINLRDHIEKMDIPYKDDVLELHHKNYKELVEDKMKRNYHIKELNWNNLMFYKGSHRIDFLKFNHSIISLIGENASGKSSIIDILVLGLFNYSLRSSRKSEMINKESDSGFVSVKFSCNGSKFEIYQELKRTYNNRAVINHDLFQDGIKITKNSVTETYKFIFNMIGDFHNFKNTSLIVQERVSLCNMKNKEFKDYLMDIFRFSPYTEICNNIEKNIKDFKKNHSWYKNKIKELNKKVSNLVLEYEELSMNELKNKIDSLREELNMNNDSYSCKKYELDNINISEFNQNVLEKKIQQLEKQELPDDLRGEEDLKLLLKELETKLKSIIYSSRDLLTNENKIISLDKENYEKPYIPYFINKKIKPNKIKEKAKSIYQKGMTSNKNFINDYEELSNKIEKNKSLLLQLQKQKEQTSFNFKRYDILSGFHWKETGSLEDLQNIKETITYNEREIYLLESDLNSKQDILNKRKELEKTIQVDEKEEENLKEEKNNLIKKIHTKENEKNNLEKEGIKTSELTKKEMNYLGKEPYGNEYIRSIKFIPNDLMMFNQSCDSCSYNEKMINERNSKDKVKSLLKKVNHFNKMVLTVKNKAEFSKIINDLNNYKINLSSIEKKINEIENTKLLIEQKKELAVLLDKQEILDKLKLENCNLKSRFNSIVSIIDIKNNLIEKQNYLIKIKEKETEEIIQILKKEKDKIEKECLKFIEYNFSIYYISLHNRNLRKKEEYQSCKDEIKIIKKNLSCFENKNELEKLFQKKEKLIKYRILEKELNNLNKTTKEIKKKIENYEKNYINLVNNNNSYEILIKEIKNYNDEMTSIEKKLEIYKSYHSCINKDKEESALSLSLTKLIQQLEIEINRFLDIDFSVKISLKDKIEIYKNNNIIPGDLCSGYQKFSIDIAFRIALRYFMPSNPFALIIDEGFSCLDPFHYEKIIEKILSYKNDYKFILLITHIEDLKNQTDFIITPKEFKN